MSQKNEVISIYTDGSVVNNYGAWAYIVFRGLIPQVQKSGTKRNTSSQEMELTAIVNALRHYKRKKTFYIYTDDLHFYQVHDDEKSKPARLNPQCRRKGKYAQLWAEFYRLVDYHDVSIKYVKGHAGNKCNCLVDKFVRKAARAFEKKETAKKCLSSK